MGVVQGIGFRPFIYHQATKHQLVGYVLNTGNSAVKIVVEGDKPQIIDFINSIETEKPKLAVIDEISTSWRPATGEYEEFLIQVSRHETTSGGSIIPADIAVCDECMEDITSHHSRHYHYPFTCCAICGPRYTTIINTPYDRERTTMQEFPLCEDCLQEYNSPEYRRYNAQTICCPRCGPKFQLLDQKGTLLASEEAFPETVKLLNEGAIIAIKGLGGIHLAVSASLDSQIQRLRNLRLKPNKPLAIMSPNLQNTRMIAQVSKEAERLLTSWKRPIVVLPKNSPFPLAKSLAPGLDTIGVMHPYSGIYQLLFEGLEDFALVMTSANPSGLPTLIHSSTFQKHFMHMADYFLTHNRTIHQRCDDSVVIPFNHHSLIVRRSRGFTPEPIETNNDGSPVLAVGALEKNTGACYLRKRIFLTQHIGDVDSLETLDFLKTSVTHLQKLLRIKKFNSVACDLHPDFLTTRYAETIAKEYELQLARVQHHHAHLATLIIDNQLSEEEDIVAICCDGAGYGADNTTWGGEILVGDARSYVRTAHLQTHKMPGGDLAAKYPFRMLVSILSERYSMEDLFSRFKESSITALPQGEKEFDIILRQLKGKTDFPITSSTGRVLDAISTLLGVCHKRTYEGEPAIRLEATANKGRFIKTLLPEISITRKGKTIIINTMDLLGHIYRNLDSHSQSDLALAAHLSLGKALAEVAVDIANREGLRNVGFTGGVAFNKILTKVIKEIVTESELQFITHRHVPPGDAGVSVGQAFVARATYE
ncbi:MAG: carbamoyltransferase HypF [Promethearchaeota archaeon]